MDIALSCGHTRLHDGCAECIALQAKWYALLQVNGFVDAENTQVSSRPLKTWTGVSIQVIPHGGDEAIDIIDLIASQSPDDALRSAFPEGHLSNKEHLLYHPDFDALCESICSHGNHKLIPENVRTIWVEYIEGHSNRTIADRLGINDTLAWRTINTMTQWMELMDLDTGDEAEPLAKVVLRGYAPNSEDKSFIFATWRNVLWYDEENKKEGGSDRFFRAATASIRNILANRGTKVRIAGLDDKSDFIVGYSVITGNCLHFVYVRPSYRGNRIGSLLVPKLVETVSPIMTKLGRAIAVKRGYIKQNKENQDGQAERVEE